MLLEKEKLRKADLLMSVILMGISLFFLLKSINMEVENEPIYTSPGLLPSIICLLILGSSIHLFISSWKEGAKITISDIKSYLGSFREERTIRILMTVGIFLFYIFVLLQFFNFLISTFIYLSIFLYLFKAGNIFKVFLISSLTAFSISYIFGELVSIPLP